MFMAGKKQAQPRLLQRCVQIFSHPNVNDAYGGSCSSGDVAGRQLIFGLVL